MNPVICLPHNFLSRVADRHFIGLMEDIGIHRDRARLSLFLLWKDFAQHGGGERLVPMDAAQRSRDIAVRVIEEVCEWQGDRGAMVETAIAAGVLKLVEVEEGRANLTLTDFSATRAPGSAGGGDSLADRGARKATRCRTETPARRDAQDALGLFESTRSDLTDALGKDRLREALSLLFQISRIMGWKNPEVTAWTREMIEEADALLRAHERAAINRRLEWLVQAKKNDEVPGRLDLIIKRWDTLQRAS
jgi:hypothetical protein